MSLDYFNNIKYEINPQKFKIYSILLNLRKKLHIFEFTPLKSKHRVLNFQKNIILPSQNELLKIEKEIKGFNIEAFLIGLIISHTTIVLKNKILLNEMGGKKAFIHISMCVSFGIINGFLFGYSYAKSYGLYKAYKQALCTVDKISKDFEYFYVSKHEEVFDE